MKKGDKTTTATINAPALEKALELAAITISYAELIRIALADEDEQDFHRELKKLRKLVKDKITEASTRPAAPQALRTGPPAKHRDESPRPAGTPKPTAPE